MKNIIKRFLNLINPLYRSFTIHFTNKDLDPIYKNVKLKTIPSIGDKVFFNEEGDMYYVIDVVHYYNNFSHLVYVVIEKSLM